MTGYFRRLRRRGDHARRRRLSRRPADHRRAARDRARSVRRRVDGRSSSSASSSRRSSPAPCAPQCSASASSTTSQAARLRNERAPLRHVRRDPAERDRRRSSSSSRCGSATPSSPSPRLAFLGFGIRPSVPDWGQDIAENYGFINAGVWWPVLFPALAIATLIVGVNLIADAIAQRLRAMTTPAHRSSRTSTSPTACAASTGRVLRGVVLRRSGEGEAYGLVGESGCGKSTAAFAIVRYLPRNGGVTRRLDPPRRRGHARDERAPSCAGSMPRPLSMVYQNPASALNPSIRVGTQLAEVFAARGCRAGEALRPSARRCCARCRSPTRRASCAATRTSSRAACSSASSSRWRSRRTRRCSSSTSRRPASTPPSRPRCSTSSPRCARSSARASSSSATTSRVIAKMCDRVGVLYAGRLVEEGAGRRRLPRPAPPLHGRPAALHPARRRAQGRDRARHDPGLPAAASARRCRAASSPTAAGSRRRSAASRSRRSIALGHGAREPLPLPRRGARAPARSRPARLAGRATRERRRRCSSRARSQDLQAGRPGLPRPRRRLARRPRRARRSASSASRAAARRRSRGVLLGLSPPDAGSTLELDGKPLARQASSKRSTEQVRALQIVFQNPDSALNRRHTVRRIIGRALDEARSACAASEAERARARARRGRPPRPSAPRRASPRSSPAA